VSRRDNAPSVPLPRLRALLREEPDRLLRTVPGIHPVDKPGGMTSHDAVAIARKRLGLRRVGHAGTLDPMATGLLLLLAGNATRLFDDLQRYPKTYVAQMRLGVRTDTADRTGTTLDERPVSFPSPEELDAQLDAFRGEILQTPPMHSALKRDGRPLYELAREGKVVEREARPATVYGLACTGSFPDRAELELTMTVASGFYVRTLIDDLGAALGCGAHMSALRRTRTGPFPLEEAIAPGAIEPAPPLS
jgi:tRNA pseudouridine55 synthase